MKKQLIPVNFGGFGFIWGFKTYVMGIVNASVESFSGDGTDDLDKLLTRVGQAVADGADIIDVGGLSTRPGFKEISVEEEKGRIIPLIKEIRCAFDIAVSCDTYRVKTAEEALKSGANIINDVSGLSGGKEMAKLIASYDAGIVLTANQREQTIEDDICDAVINDLNRQIEICRACGVKDQQIILDPGIGFGKSVEQNYELIGEIDRIKALGFPVLLGVSNKSFLSMFGDVSERKEGNQACHVIGISKGVDILRVHDVRETVKTAIVADIILRPDEDA